ncbi:MAG: hypothetical protein ACFFEN_10505 [Candidatus Thorarchaeota archaeon]
MSQDEINRLIEDHNNRHCDRFEIYQRKKINKRARRVWLSLAKKSIIKRAMELSETGIPTLETVKTVIKEREDKWEEAYKKRLRRGSSAITYIVAWVILTPLLALVINLALWGAMTGGNANYWIFLFTQGSWSFLVGAIGAIIIMVLFNELT